MQSLSFGRQPDDKPTVGVTLATIAKTGSVCYFLQVMCFQISKVKFADKWELTFQWFVTIVSHNNPQILDFLCAFLTSLDNSAMTVLSCHTAARLVELEHQTGGANGNVSPGHHHTPDMSALDTTLFNPDSYRHRGNWKVLYSSTRSWFGVQPFCEMGSTTADWILFSTWALNLDSKVVAIQFPLLSVKQNHSSVPLATLGVWPCPKDYLPKC